MWKFTLCSNSKYMNQNEYANFKMKIEDKLQVEIKEFLRIEDLSGAGGWNYNAITGTGILN